MNEDKLRELEAYCNDIDFYKGSVIGKDFLDLIKYVRQLEKDNAELLAAIWPLIDESHKATFAEIDYLAQVYTKNKGDETPNKAKAELLAALKPLVENFHRMMPANNIETEDWDKAAAAYTKHKGE